MKKILAFALSFSFVGCALSTVTISNPPSNPKLKLILHYKNGQRQKKGPGRHSHWEHTSGEGNFTKTVSIKTGTSLAIKYKSNKSLPRTHDEAFNRVINAKLQSIDVQKNGATIETITISTDGTKHKIKSLLKDKYFTLRNPNSKTHRVNAHYSDGSLGHDVTINKDGSPQFYRLKHNKWGGQRLVKIVVKKTGQTITISDETNDYDIEESKSKIISDVATGPSWLHEGSAR